MRAGLRIIGFFASVLAILVAVVVGFSLWAIYHPEQAFKIASPLIMPSGIQSTWTSVQAKTQKTDWKHWKLDWSFQKLSLQRGAPRLNLVFDLNMQATISLFEPKTGIVFDNLEITTASPAFFETSATSESTGRNPFEEVEVWRKRLAWINRFFDVTKIKVKIPELTLMKGAKVLGKFGLAVNKPGAKDPLAVDSSLSGKTEKLDAVINTSLRLDQATSGAVFFKGTADMKGPALTGDGEFDLAIPENKLVANYKGKSKFGKSAATVDGSALIEAGQISLKGKSDFENLPGGLSSVRGADWSAELPLWPGVVLSHLAGHLNITAPVALTFITPQMKEQLEKNCQCKWPMILKATLDGKFWASHIFDVAEDEMPVATLDFKFEPLSNPLILLNLKGEMRVTHTKEDTFRFAPSVDAAFKLPNFQAIKGLLEANKIMVPSPFDILQGSIEATMRTTLWQSSKGLVIPIEAKVDLASSDQKVNLDSKINLYIPEDFKSVDIMFDSTVHDFIVELPPLDPVMGLPQLSKDSRVLMNPETPIDPNAFKFRVMYGIRTSKPGGIRLLSKLAKPAIPMSLDLDRTAKGDTLGTVKIEPFELNYMHRSMNIDLLRVILDDRETADFAVDGRLRMEQSQAKVNIVVSGSLRSPLIKLTSDPEMSRSDIVSILLYDRTSDQLVSADRETVGSFEAAIQDRAIGLLGLWVFASTPIRSFSYNPLTKVYTATVKLAEGTTASIGTDWEEAAQLEVRKRVTRRWVLTASWAPSDSKEQSGKLVLQWEKRF